MGAQASRLSEDTGPAVDTTLLLGLPVCHIEPSFLRNMHSNRTHSHLENWPPLLFLGRGCGAESGSQSQLTASPPSADSHLEPGLP